MIKLLKTKKIYEKEVDDLLIDQFIFNVVLIDDAQQDIATRGAMVNIATDRNKKFMQQNFAIGILHNAIKSNNTILKQLGLDKVKIEVDKTSDAFNNLKSLLN